MFLAPHQEERRLDVSTLFHGSIAVTSLPSGSLCVTADGNMRRGELSARIVDNATSGPPCSRARTGAGARAASPTWHKARYYLECRDPEFAEKMAEVLCVYHKVISPEEGRGPVEDEAERQGGDHRLRREARYPGDRNDVPRSAPPNPACMRPSHATMNTSATARVSLLPASIC